MKRGEVGRLLVRLAAALVVSLVLSSFSESQKGVETHAAVTLKSCNALSALYGADTDTEHRVIAYIVTEADWLRLPEDSALLQGGVEYYFTLDDRGWVFHYTSPIGATVAIPYNRERWEELELARFAASILEVFTREYEATSC